MATFKVESVASKASDWKVVTIYVESEGQSVEASVNRTSKKGEAFPGFDDIKEGAMIEGELWRSDAGKVYLFPPKKVQPWRGSSTRRDDMKAANEMQDASITKHAENRELGIKLAGAMRDATLFTIEELRINAQRPLDNALNVKDTWRTWRDFFVKEFDSEMDRLKNQPF